MKEAREIVSDSRLQHEKSQKGFTLVEVAIAMVILLVALLGVFVTFTYAINYNAGNNSRAQALAVLQQQVELCRSAKFTPEVMDGSSSVFDLTGGTKATKTVTSADGGRYLVDVKVDDDPSTTTVIDTNSLKTIKEITIKVTLDRPTPGWQTSLPATVVLRRVRAN